MSQYYDNHVCATGEFAYHGHRVKLYDHNEAALNSAYSRIEEDKAYLIEEGLLASQNFVVVVWFLLILLVFRFDFE